MTIDPGNKICPYCGTPGKPILLINQTVYDPNCKCIENLDNPDETYGKKDVDLSKILYESFKTYPNDKIYIIDDGQAVYKLVLNHTVVYDSKDRIEIRDKAVEMFNNVFLTNHDETQIRIKRIHTIPDRLKGKMMINTIWEVTGP